jgi:hypothetical protein
MLVDIGTRPSAERDAVLRDFARFTVDLHEKRVRRGDYNARNIFYCLGPDGHYRFTLIDINRVQFRRMPMRVCVKEFRRLLERPELVAVAGQYAELRGWNPDLFCGAVLMERALNPRDRLKKVLHALIRPFTRRKK